MHETNTRSLYINRLIDKISSNISLQSIFDANKLTKSNFLEWYRNLRIVLKQERRLYVFESHIPRVSNEDALIEVKTKYHRHIDDDEQATCVILASMSPKLQIEYENMDAYNMIKHLK